MNIWPFQETIKDLDGNPYLVRYTLFKCPLLRIYLHKILRPDHDRHLHDHPWNFTTRILLGGYWEELPCSPIPHTVLIKRERGTVIPHKAEEEHRIDTLLRVPTWTLMTCGRKRKDWGFFVDGMYVPSDLYLKTRGINLGSDR